MEVGYSEIRFQRNKWKYRGFEYTNDMVHVRDQWYLKSELENRKRLKMDQKLVGKVYELWKNVNPFGIAGISKCVHYHLLQLIYKKLYKSQLSSETVDEMAKLDLDLDFNSKSCMYFTRFYDTVFDIIDQNTNSKILSEYISAVGNIIGLIQSSVVFQNLNLHLNSHCQNKKPRFYHWMKQSLKIKTLQKYTAASQVALPCIKTLNYHLEKISPLSVQKRKGITKGFLLEDVIQSRHAYLSKRQDKKYLI